MRIEHERSRFGERLADLADNLDELDEAHTEALKIIEAQNADINFDLTHRHTVVRVSANRISVGSESETYAPLMTMDGEEVANVYRRKATE